MTSCLFAVSFPLAALETNLAWLTFISFILLSKADNIFANLSEYLVVP